MNEKVSIIIPAGNEANSIGNLISTIKESVSAYEHEIIVVDDGSTDGTREIAQSKGAIVISHEKNLGKGASIRTGAENAKGDILVFLDGDGAHDPHDIPNMITLIIQNKADLTIGSRAFSESKIPISYLPRRLANSLASFILSVMVSFFLPLVTLFKCPMRWVKMADSQSGFKAIDRIKWRKLDLVSQGFEIETEIIYEAARNRLAIADVPISCNYSSEISRLSILRDGLKTLRLLAKKLMGELGLR